jgi:hypothetical protein
MPAQHKPVAYDTVVRVREDYVSGKKASQIMAECEITSHRLYQLLAGKGEAAGLPAIALRSELRDTRARPREPDRARASLVDRLWRTADRQVRDIERRLRLETQKPDERERDARMLAIMVKTLRELRALDAARAEQEPTSEDEPGPDNLDDFRRDLVRKMDAIIAARETPADHGVER